MALERFNDTNNQLETKGITTSPNTEAALLETYLGIMFPVKPHKVILTARNQLAMIQSEPTLTKKIFAALRAINYGKKEVAGYYDSEIFTYFCKPNSIVNNGLHENMHAYVDLTNPEIQKEVVHQSKLIGINKNDEQTNENPNPEKMVAYQTFHEGMALWGEFETAFNLSHDLSTAARREQKQMLTGNISSVNKDAISLFIAVNFQSLAFGVGYYRNIDQNNLSGTLKYINKAHKYTNYSRYVAGYYFIRLAMNKLLESSLSIKDSLNLLIANPPQALEKMVEPSAYAANLISS